MSTVTVQNKSELGMNRNDFYEYKKNRMVELVKNGEGIQGIASDLGMGEKDVYSFISRNFGGLRNLKSMIESGMTMPQTVGVLAAAPTKRGRKPANSVDKVENKSSNAKIAKKVNQKIYKSANLKGNKSSNLSDEKKKIMDEFKNGMDKEIQATVKDIQQTLERVKMDIVNQFKSDIMRELSTLASSM